MSETSPTTHRSPVKGQRKIGSIGVPYPNTDAKIVDIETGKAELPNNQAGELIIMGPQVMKGDWGNLEETSMALREGWLYTGDIATMDEEGYFFIVDRKKELIIAGGYSIYPIEVEEVIYQHPGVEEACVFGIPDTYLGETVKAVIVLKKGIIATEQDIMKFCNERMPKSAVGKILRRVLVEEEGKGTNSFKTYPR